ncbi:MAG: hypothetical protein K1W16_03235 [Lachnospiraceae bacterium]|jgi:hypothetical protein
MIYEYEQKEGFYLISELEKLRKKKRHDKLVVKCDETTNPQVVNFKRIYLLDGAVNTILYNAKNYYIYINNNDITVYLIYDTCRIAYCLRTENDWKIIGVEFLPSARLNTPPHKDDLVGRTLTSTLIRVLSFCYTLGFSNVFDTKQTGQIQKICTAIMNKEFINNKFEPEYEIQQKINLFLMKHAIRGDFAEKYLLQKRH